MTTPSSSYRHVSISLRLAERSDKPEIYQWLAQSDVTSSMMGPPDYADHPIPTWDEFDADYTEELFGPGDASGGKCFIIELDAEAIGVVCHSELDRQRRETELDIWLKSQSLCGQGYGPHALRLLMQQLHREHHIDHFFIRPSARNTRAIAAYQKAGFQLLTQPPMRYLRPEELDYADSVVLVKEFADE
ncbi:MAG: GNAT family N-acetyltransferase [Gammaproteobacteria bacterium]|nr:GNAT family N-acetyltransferase [Gammaproteobacteria bacterium]